MNFGPNLLFRLEKASSATVARDTTAFSKCGRGTERERERERETERQRERERDSKEEGYKG
jgi:hypothetical protein